MDLKGCLCRHGQPLKCEKKFPDTPRTAVTKEAKRALFLRLGTSRPSNGTSPLTSTYILEIYAGKLYCKAICVLQSAISYLYCVLLVVVKSLALNDVS